MPPVEFEPTISASERPQTHALDRAATGIGYIWLNDLKFIGCKIIIFYLNTYILTSLGRFLPKNEAYTIQITQFNLLVITCTYITERKGPGITCLFYFLPVSGRTEIA